jgi:hypothetical protein
MFHNSIEIPSKIILYYGDYDLFYTVGLDFCSLWQISQASNLPINSVGTLGEK